MYVTGSILTVDGGYTTNYWYDETGQRVITLYKGRKKPQSQKDANRAHARLRGPGERANAQLKYWRILHNSAAARTTPAGWPKSSTCYRTARSPQDENAQYLKAPIVVIWDNLNTHISAAMRS